MSESTVRLFHFSKEPLMALLETSPVPDNEHKPGGLWLSDEAQFGWSELLRTAMDSGDPDWSDANEWFRNVYSFDIDPSGLAVLSSEADVLSFARQYGEVQHRSCGDNVGLHIQWSLVKAHFKGILISPWQERLSHRNGDPEMHWYRFDCASACVWDTSCVVEWAPLPTNPWIES